MKYKTEKNKQVLCLCFDNTSYILLDICPNKVYFKYTSEFKNKYINIEVYFKYTSEFEHKYRSLESLINK